MKAGPITKRFMPLWQRDGEDHVWHVAYRFELVIIPLLLVIMVLLEWCIHLEQIPVAK
jgi:hypothetical protein